MSAAVSVVPVAVVAVRNVRTFAPQTRPATGELSCVSIVSLKTNQRKFFFHVILQMNEETTHETK